MELGEKLQALRKGRGLTQEELAQALFVSRTAVSKWESGRGYPSIESLKDISVFFSVSIDELLSGEKLISIAEKENKSNVRGICDFLFGISDLLFTLPMFLPLYPNAADGFVYSVSLMNYAQGSEFNKFVYWILFAALTVTGIVKLILTKTQAEKKGNFLTALSVVLNVIAVLFLTLAREAYAAAVAFLIMVVKGTVISKYKYRTR
ncbi:MAG: helix-turn-helix transcriptional regulator [Clostridia bacterium]|nr:helix-turn-helix transcriptional regulator [Clostridia bacterium]